MLGHARWAIAPPAALHDLRPHTAIGAEAMALVPTEDGLGFGKRRHVLRADNAVQGDAAQIGQLEIIPYLQSLDRSRIEPDAEARRIIRKAEEYAFGPKPERARLIE